MNETLAFYAIRTVPGFPLGQPLDGRDRYGMTPEMAGVYRWLVENRPHDRAFAINFRELFQSKGKCMPNGHRTVQCLIERGWLDRDDAGYRFVQPVMHFKEPQ